MPLYRCDFKALFVFFITAFKPLKTLNDSGSDSECSDISGFDGYVSFGENIDPIDLAKITTTESSLQCH
jgi:hypothetical protein